MFPAVIVVHAFQVPVRRWLGHRGLDLLLNRPTDLLSLVSAVLSNLVATSRRLLLLEPAAQACRRQRRDTAWRRWRCRVGSRATSPFSAPWPPDRLGEDRPGMVYDLVLGVSRSASR